jgi:hypothetical protein
LGAKVTYITKPNSRYDSGDLTLVDGQFGARPWRGYQWVGFDTNTIEINIELVEKRKTKSLELGFLYEPSSWIHLPSEVKIITDSGKTKNVNITSERTVIRFGNKTQSLRLQIIGPKTIPIGFPGEGSAPWIFMDEVIIR